jgi:hypothetical protein
MIDFANFRLNGKIIAIQLFYLHTFSAIHYFNK